MNTGQMMITIVAMVLLATTIVTVNRGYLTTNVTMDQNRIDILATSLATSIIEDATSLPYDEKTIGAAVTSTSSLSTKLGLEGTESSSKPNLFDDFDDYNCYSTTPKVDTIDVPGTTQKVVFNTYCKVDYIDQNNPNTTSATATWHKRIKLRVFRPGMKDLNEKTDTIKISSIYSYWYFR